MLLFVRVVEADPEGNRMSSAGEFPDLGHSTHDRSCAVGEYETRPKICRVLKYGHHILDDEGLTSSEGELPDIEAHGLVEQWAHVGKRYALESIVAGF